MVLTHDEDVLVSVWLQISIRMFQYGVHCLPVTFFYAFTQKLHIAFPPHMLVQFSIAVDIISSFNRLQIPPSVWSFESRYPKAHHCLWSLTPNFQLLAGTLGSFKKLAETLNLKH